MREWIPQHLQGGRANAEVPGRLRDGLGEFPEGSLAGRKGEGMRDREEVAGSGGPFGWDFGGTARTLAFLVDELRRQCEVFLNIRKGNLLPRKTQVNVAASSNCVF